LEEQEVHVWRASLDAFPEAGALAAGLSADEQQRAGRFRVPQVRSRFIAARSILRNILGRYLECAPSLLRFHYREHGKPFLAPNSFRDDLRFNLSHSHGLALYAVSRAREVGIDLERIRSDREHQRLAERFFSPREAAALRDLAPEDRIDAFFQCWTRKEAYLKARGEGLAIPLASFSVSLAPGEPAALVSVDGDDREAARWWLSSIDPGPGFAAALAVEGAPSGLRLWDWQVRPFAPPGRPGS
jgi:4'-phosphopantetheinyl transferase